MRRWLWPGFLVAIGAASIAVEIIGLRFLAPIFGSSLPVWGVAIATVLAGLAWGYGRGARLAERLGPGEAVGAVLQRAMAGLAVFLWLPVVMMLAGDLRDRFLEAGQGWHLAGALAASYGALLVPSVVFGAISPLAVQAESEWRGEVAGKAAGRVSMLMTWGSLIGILLPSLLLIPWLGSRASVWVMAGVPWVLGEIHLYGRGSKWGHLRWWAVAAVGLSIWIQGQEAGVLAAVETKHQHVEVVQVPEGRALMFDAGWGIQSLLPEGLYTGYYWDYLASLPALISNDNVRVLVVGAAASTTERQMARFWEGEKRLAFTSVELDEAVVRVAEEYFDPPAREVVVADGRAFVEARNDRHDIVIVDAYARELTVPFHLATAEFFAAVERVVAEGGVVAVNLNAGDEEAVWIRSMARTMRQIWPKVVVAAVPRTCNYLLLASHETLAAGEVPAAVEPLLPALEEAREPRVDGWLLTDDKAATDWLGMAALADPGGAC